MLTKKNSLFLGSQIFYNTVAVSAFFLLWMVILTHDFDSFITLVIQLKYVIPIISSALVSYFMANMYAQKFHEQIPLHLRIGTALFYLSEVVIIAQLVTFKMYQDGGIIQHSLKDPWSFLFYGALLVINGFLVALLLKIGSTTTNNFLFAKFK